MTIRSRATSRAAALAGLVLVGLVLVDALSASPARAGEETAAGEDTGAQAVALGQEGVQLYEDGKWDEALERLQRADALFHSPVFVLYAARCLRNGGRLLEARAAYERVVAEEVPESAPNSWRLAQTDGRAELGALRGEIPELTVTVTGSTGTAAITIDDRRAEAGAPLELDPGKYTVVASDGTRRVEKTVKLARGDRDARVTLQLTEATVPVEPEEDGSMDVAGWALVGIGAAGLIAGGIVGGLALAKNSDAEDEILGICGGNLDRCPPSREPEIAEQQGAAYTLADVSTGLLIGGGVVAAVGVVLLLVDVGTEPASQARVALRGQSLVIRF